ncbi:MurR/RpiR family transcriptional regulator [Leucobacter sp. OH2974_COT-288]|uniref:DNA-binding MurR/RpiR family transcriptional regulator n=1 Tax=Canibacter oris TaxID=1365628 RepID=A0A840DH93_9MICO|nr:DNA-binding MurR/RpiR family transcriptional regulator [Canibacter oris]RRD34983.1 MurR/RpiR family transcriptional regulator [Leucobacter sp. OH2974_COT-288]
MSESSNIALKLVSGELKLTRSAQKIVRALLANYPAAGLSTVAELAEVSGVSGPTVIRFTKDLGFNSFKDFQDALRVELSERETSTLQQVTHQKENSQTQTLVSAVASSLNTIPLKDLNQAVQYLSDAKRRIFAVGGDYSEIAAAHLVLQLTQLRPHVSELPVKSVLAAAALCDAKKGDVLCVYDVRRYSKHTLQIAQAAKNQGLKLLLFTDKWLSPITGFSDAVIPAEVVTGNTNDSSVALLAVTELLCNQVSEHLDKEGTARLEKLDAIRLQIEQN